MNESFRASIINSNLQGGGHDADTSGGGASGAAFGSFSLGTDGMKQPVAESEFVNTILGSGLGSVLLQSCFLNGIFSFSGWPLGNLGIMSYFGLEKLGVANSLHVGDMSFGLAKGGAGKGAH